MCGNLVMLLRAGSKVIDHSRLGLDGSKKVLKGCCHIDAFLLVFDMYCYSWVKDHRS